MANTERDPDPDLSLTDTDISDGYQQWAMDGHNNKTIMR